ncbi:MAG: hypothetical protein ACRC2S_21080 [Waterburya sp.]
MHTLRKRDRSENPNSQRPKSLIIWGANPGDTTPFGATSIDYNNP